MMNKPSTDFVTIGDGNPYALLAEFESVGDVMRAAEQVRDAGYQFLICGKPMCSLPANLPIIFETTVLFAAIGTLLGLLLPIGDPRLEDSLAIRDAY